MIPRIHRYIARSRKRTGELFCLRCAVYFSGRDAYDRHLVWYADLARDPLNPGKDWCHLPEEVGLVRSGRYWSLPGGPLTLDAGILQRGGVPRFPRTNEAG